MNMVWCRKCCFLSLSRLDALDLSLKTRPLPLFDLVFTLNSYDEDDAEPSSPENPESNGQTELIVLFSIADAQDAACFILEWSKTGTALTLSRIQK